MAVLLRERPPNTERRIGLWVEVRERATPGDSGRVKVDDIGGGKWSQLWLLYHCEPGEDE